MIPPRGLVAWADSVNRIQLDWIGVPDAVGYNIYEKNSLTGVAGNPVKVTNSARGPFTESRVFEYWVKAVDSNGNLSPESNHAQIDYKPTGGSTTLPPVDAGPKPDPKNIIFQLDYSKEDTTKAGMDGWPQYQGDSDTIYKGAPFPIVNHPLLGRAVKAFLPNKTKRREVMPPSKVRELAEGADVYIRKDIVLGNDFPIGQTDYWCCLEQLHQGSSSGSPPIEFDIHDNALWVRGHQGSTQRYHTKICEVERGKVYKLVYRIVASQQASKSLLEVWINDKKIISGYRPPVPYRDSGGAYLKGLGLYARVTVSPPTGMTAWFGAYRIGRTYASVAA